MSRFGQRTPTIAIIGAGASGTLTAIHLLRRARGPLDVVLLDRRSQPGRGVAYGTAFQAHLLNVRAGNMSAFPDEPRHSFEWLREAEVDSSWRAESPTEFVPRMVYGPYLEATMRAAQASAHEGVALDIRHAEVVGLAPGNSTLELRGVNRGGWLPALAARPLFEVSR